MSKLRSKIVTDNPNIVEYWEEMERIAEDLTLGDRAKLVLFDYYTRAMMKRGTIK